MEKIFGFAFILRDGEATLEEKFLKCIPAVKWSGRLRLSQRCTVIPTILPPAPLPLSFHGRRLVLTS
jgi:hypothetical protein